LNFALLALFLFSTVSSTKLRVNKQDETKPVMVTFRGYIKSGSTGKIIPLEALRNAKVTFTSENKAVYTARIVDDGVYEVTLPIGRYTRDVSVAGFISNSQHICIRSSASIDNPKHTVTLGQIIIVPPKNETKTFTIRGLIMDSTNNMPVNSTNFTINFVYSKDKSSTKAKIIKAGLYEVNLTGPGEYQIFTSGLKGYVEDVENHTISGPSNENNHKNTLFLTPEVKGWRFVLTWGNAPLDLDAHVLTPTGEEIYFDNRLSKDKHTILDVDSRKGYGPETITIKDPSPGIYQYYVNRYSNEGPIQKSDAKVVVYSGNQKIREYHVPQTGDQKYEDWHVFNFDAKANKLVDVNQIKKAERMVCFQWLMMRVCNGRWC